MLYADVTLMIHKGIAPSPIVRYTFSIEFMVIIVILLAGAATMIIRCDRAVWSSLLLLYPSQAVPLYTALFLEKREIDEQYEGSQETLTP